MTPISASRPQRVDFRVISATHGVLSSLVGAEVFQADLYARLQGAVVELPPLRERREDILPLFSHFCGQKRPGRLPRFSVRLVEALCTYAWPMNIRQLKVTAERMVILHGARQEWRRRHLRAVHPGIDQEISAVEPAGVSVDVSAPEAARRALDSASVVQRCSRRSAMSRRQLDS